MTSLIQGIRMAVDKEEEIPWAVLKPDYKDNDPAHEISEVNVSKVWAGLLFQHLSPEIQPFASSFQR